FHRRSDGLLRLLDGESDRDRPGVVGRVDHRCRLHAARGPGDAARAGDGKKPGGRGRESLGETAVRHPPREPAGVWIFPSPADGKNSAGGGTDRQPGFAEKQSGSEIPGQPSAVRPSVRSAGPILMNLSLISLELCVTALGLLVLVADLWLPADRRRFLGYLVAAALGVLFLNSFTGHCSCALIGQTGFGGMFIQDAL